MPKAKPANHVVNSHQSPLSLRQSYEAEVLKHLAEAREHEKEVIQKAIKESCDFSKQVEEKLNQRMEANKENRSARLAALSEKFKEKVSPCFVLCQSPGRVFENKK